MKPVVAIVGRPNAGKSTLFNRLTKSKDALVDNVAGVTRDRHYGSAHWNGIDYTVIDTGGFHFSADGEFSEKIHDQVLIAVEDADAIIVLFDGSQGPSPWDREMVSLLRGVSTPVFYTVNKIDSHKRDENLFEFYSLGIESISSLSAEHGHGVMDLMDKVTEILPRGPEAEEEKPLRIAIVGRPNVGKSSLVNQITGEDRLIVSDVPGTTRDSIDTPFTVNGKPYLLIDTAGIRRKSKVNLKLEKYTIIKALESLERCDIALIMIDAADGIAEQDIKIAGYAFERGCACIFLLNKWDLVEKNDRTLKTFKEDLRYRAKYLNFAPLLSISAKTGRRVQKIFQLVEEVNAQYTARIGTGPLNRILRDTTEKTEPSMFQGRRLKFFYITQTFTRPPTFVCFVNFPEGVHFSYQRYLTNQIREATSLNMVPLRLELRKRSEAEGRLRPPKKFHTTQRSRKPKRPKKTENKRKR